MVEEFNPFKRPQANFNHFNRPQADFNHFNRPQADFNHFNRPQANFNPFNRPQADFNPFNKPQADFNPLNPFNFFQNVFSSRQPNPRSACLNRGQYFFAGPDSARGLDLNIRGTMFPH